MPKIFDFLNQINNKTSKFVYDKKIAPAYQLSMWLSHNINLIDIVQEINHLQFNLNDDIIYKYYMDKVPKKRRFIKWTKKSKTNEKDIDKTMIKYNVSANEAKNILKHERAIE